MVTRTCKLFLHLPPFQDSVDVTFEEMNTYLGYVHFYLTLKSKIRETNTSIVRRTQNQKHEGTTLRITTKFNTF